MELHRLRYFVALAKDLSFRSASYRLGIAQPSLTKQIAAVEDELGLDLLVRQKNRIVGLTAAGESYLNDARRILSEIESAAISARAIAEGNVGRLRLGVCDDATTGKLAPVLNAFCSRLPGVAFDLFELSSPDQVDAIRRSEIDIGIVTAPIDEGDLLVEELWREDWHVAFPIGHELNRSNQLSCTDLMHTGLILAHPQYAPGGHDQVRRTFMAAGISPRVVVQALRRSTMIMLAAGGAGVTFLPTSVAAVGLPGLEVRPFQADRLVIAAVFRAKDPPGLAMQFLRVAQEIAARDLASQPPGEPSAVCGIEPTTASDQALRLFPAAPSETPYPSE